MDEITSCQNNLLQPLQFGDDLHFDIVSYMLHMHVKSNWQNGVIQMVPPVEVKTRHFL